MISDPRITCPYAGVSMNITLFKNRKFNEILSITGIMAVIFYLDMKLGFLSSLSEMLLNAAPGLNGYMITMVGSMWAGLMVYSYFRRRQTLSAIIARNHIKAELDSQKLLDANTGIPNRRGFERVVNNSLLLLTHPHWSVMAIEISNMKSIKNVHGIDAGHAVERAIAVRLSKMINPVEFIAYDETSIFYLVCPSDAEDEVNFRIDQIVDELSTLVENGIELDEKSYNVQFDFAEINSNLIDRTLIRPELDGLAKRLGFALQQSNGYGKNSVVKFDRAMETVMKRQLLVESSLLEAIKSKRIIPNFQPIIDIATSQVTGFEILARWNHHDAGEISPEEFVPVAEELGLLGLMTVSILEQSCEIAKNWPDHIKLAINVSPNDLRNEDLVIKLIDVLNESGTDPTMVEIEITENAFVDDSKRVSGAVGRLKEQGISISIDDFGTGYSSLHQLRSIPFDKIKIDQSFIKDIATNVESQAIVKSVIALGDSLGLATIAEGIELGDNHDMLKKMGCKLGQGYLFSKPMSGDDVGKLLAEQDGSLVSAIKAA